MKTVLITGCSSGIGYLAAIKFAQNGWQVIAGVRKETDIFKDFKNIKTVKLDVTKDKDVGGLKIKNIDVLVNNAGFGFVGPVETFSIDEVKEQYETNLFGMIRMVKKVAPIMRKNKKGLIINISSINGLIPFPLYGVYSSSKYAMETLSEVMNFELGHFGIRVVLVEPGTFLTNFWKNVKLTSENKIYKGLVDSFLAKYEKAKNIKWLEKTLDPQRVADKVWEIANDDNPRLRNVIGWDAGIYLILKKILPNSWWQKLLKMAYVW